MPRSKMELINREHFSILHELLMEKCYGEKAMEAARWPDVELYGHNRSDRYPRKNSIRSKMGSVKDFRAFGEAVLNYKFKKPIKISEQLLEECMKFLGYNDLKDMETDYCGKRNIESYEAPVDLKYSRKRLGQHDPKDDPLSRLAQTNWWCYSHLVLDTEHKKREIRRLPLRIKTRTSDGDYELELRSAPPYTSFSGRIRKKFSNNNVLTCELTSQGRKVKKRLYLFVHIDPGASKDFYLGCFLRHTDRGDVYTGSFIMQKIRDENTVLEPDDFEMEHCPEDQVPGSILDFLYDKTLNRLSVPSGIYTIEDFEKWLYGEPEKKWRKIPKYDLLITAPIKGFDHQDRRYNMLKDDLLDALHSILPVENQEKSEILKGVENVLKTHMLVTDTTGAAMDFEAFRQKVLAMKQRFEEEVEGFDNIWYSAGEEGFSMGRKTDSSTLLLRQLSRFIASKRVLLLLPSSMISSVFLEVGWAMITERNIPVFIVANRRDLPFLLQKADTLKNRRIYMTSWEEIGGIEGVPDWILDNGWHKI